MRVLLGIAFDEGDADLEALVAEAGIADGGEGSEEGREAATIQLRSVEKSVVE